MRRIGLFVGLSLIGSAAGAVQFVNGSFELGTAPGKSMLVNGGDTTTLTGWKITGNNIDVVGTGWDASNGVRSLDLSGTAPGGILQTVHGLTVGSIYQITFDMSGSYTGSRTTPNVMSVSASGNPASLYSFDKVNTVHDMMYNSLTYNFIPTQSVSVIRFNGLDNSNYGAVLDNVAIQLAPPGSLIGGGVLGVGSVPEPATWGMMLGGFGLIGLSMRRRKASVSVAA